MAIKIQTQRTLTPIEIGELKFEIDITDQKYRAFLEKFKAIQKEIIDLAVELEEKEKQGEEINDEQAYKQLGEIVREAYDVILGEGAFKRVYEQTPRIISVAGYLNQLLEGIQEEMNLNQGPEISKFLKAKQNKLKKK